MKELIKKLTATLGKYRLTFGDEAELQDQLAEIFSREGIGFDREFVLSPEDRPDFWVAPWAIEVKVGGSVNKHLRQVQRYNRHALVAGTILICTKPFGFMIPEHLAGKPVGFINVGGNRL